MEQIAIAIIGLGPAGLAALKTLREEGFNAVAFERRDRVGGLWSFSPNPAYTSVTGETVCNSSKFISGFSDFPIPKGAPAYLSGAQAAAYFASYAERFELYPHIRFGTTVTKVLRNATDDGWDLHFTARHGQPQVLPFHKFVLASGSDSRAVWPDMPGRHLFRGTVLHSQEYKGPEPFAAKRVLVVGLGNTGCDTAVSLAKRAAAVHHAYRRGGPMVSRYDDAGVPFDAGVPWPALQLKYRLDDWAPWLATRLVDTLLERKMVADTARTEPLGPSDDDGGGGDAARYRRAAHRVRHDWCLRTGPSFAHRPPAVQEDWIPAVRRGAVAAAPAAGFRAFVGPDAVSLDDGTVLAGLDAVVFCTGYALDWRLVPELPMNDGAALPGDDDDGTGVPPLPRLYHLLFPPRWADSAAVLSYVAPRENVWAVCELASMAVAQLWAGAAADAGVSTSSPSTSPSSPPPPPSRPPPRFPSRAAMEAAVDADHAWWRQQHAREPRLLPGTARSAATLTRFLHDAAGTGVFERHAYGGAGLGGTLSRWWRWWWRRDDDDDDDAVATAVARGPANAYLWRLWDTNPAGVPGCGRRAWPGAREAVLNTYAEYEDLRKTKMAEKAAAETAESTR